MGKQKVVIEVPMNGQKSRLKAMKIAVGVPGVESAVVGGQDKNQLAVVGDGIDAVGLTTLLMKKVGYSVLLSVDPVPEKKDDQKKSRLKAMKIAVGVPGVESADVGGQEKNQLEVVGDGIDAVYLTTLLRKSVGYSELVSVDPVPEKKDDQKKNEATAPVPVVGVPVVGYYPYPYPYGEGHVYEIRDQNPDCSTMDIFSWVKRKIMRRDIKGANILVDPNGEIKLEDFGMAKHFNDGLLSSCGDEPIILSTTNCKDQHDAALLPFVNMDTYIHMSSPQPIGKIVQLESSEQKPLEPLGQGCSDSMELEQPGTLEELGMDPENEGIISDFLGFVRKKESCKKVGKAWTRFYMLYEPPGSHRSSLITAMANYLKFDIYDLDLTSLSSVRELQDVLFSTTNRSLIAIRDFDHCATKLPILKNELTVSLLSVYVDDLLSTCGDERIIVFTTTHRNRHDAALLLPVNVDIYVQNTSPQPVALPDEGETVQIDSSEHKPLVDFDATSNRTYKSGVLVSNSEKKNTRGAKGRCMTKSVPSFDAPDNRAHLVGAHQSTSSLELEQPENEGIISDLLGFLRDKEFYKRIGKAWKRGYLLYDSPCTDRSSLITAMANFLEFDIYHLDLTSLTSISELTNVLVSIRNRSLIAIKDFDQWAGKLPDFKTELTLSGLLKLIHGLLSSCGDEQIIVLTTNHNHIGGVDVTLLRPLNIDLYIHTSSPQPKALPDGGEIVLLDSSEQKPLVYFDATNKRAYHSDVLVSNSEEKNTREASRRQCMPEGVLSLVDSTIRISLTDFNALDNNVHLVREYQSGPFVFNSEKKDAGKGLNRECLTKSALSLDDSAKPRPLPDFDATENTAVKVYARRGRGCWDSMELEQRTTLEELGMDPENEGIISDLLRFVSDKEEFYKKAGKDWKMGYLLYDSPGTDRSSLIAAMANFLEFDIYHLDLTGLTSISELTNVLVSIRNRSLIAIKDFDQWAGKLPDLMNKLTLSGLSKIIHGLLSSCGDEQIIVLTTNHNHIDRVDVALLHPLNIDLYIHTSSPQLKALPDGGEIVLLDSSEQKPSVDFYATNNRAYQSDVLVSNSEEKNMREASRRQCMPEHVLSLVDSTARISSTDFDASDSRAHLVRAYQSGLVVFNSEKKDMGEGLSRECLTKSVLSLDDSRKQKSLSDDAVTKKKSHLVREYQCGPIVSLSDDKNRGEPLKRECFNKSIFGIDDLQQHSGGRRDDAAKSFCEQQAFDATNTHLVKADERGPTVSNSEKGCTREALKRDCLTNALSLEDLQQHFGARRKDAAKGLCDSPAWKSFEVLDSLPLAERSNNIRHLARQRALTHTHCVQLKKSQDLLRSLQRDCSGGLASQSDIGLPDGEHILSLLKKKIVRKTLKRKGRTMSVLSLEDHQQHFGRRWEDAVKFLGAKRICRQLAIHRETAAKRIRRQLGTHRWLFKQSAISFPDGGHILSLSEKKIVRKTLKRKRRNTSVLSLEDHKQHVDRWWEDAVKSHGTKRICRQLGIHRLSTAKRTHKQHGIHLWPFQRSAISLPDGQHVLPLSEKKMVRKTLKRKCRSMSVLSLVDRQQHVDRRWEDATKNIGAKRICRQLVIHHVSIAKRICRQHGIHHRWPFERDWATMKGYSLGDERPVEVISLSTHAKLVSRLQLIYISWLGRFSPRPSALPVGGGIVGPITLSLSESAATKNIAQRIGQDQSGSAASDSENERTREQEDLEEIYTSITSDDLRRLYGRMNRKDAAASLDVSIATFKRKCREFGIKRWPHVRKKKVGRPPDQHGEGNTSAVNPENGLIIGSSSEWTSQVEAFLMGHVSESSNLAFPAYSDAAAPSQPVATILQTMPMTTHMIPQTGGFSGIFQLEGQLTQSTSHPNPNVVVPQEPQIASTQMLSENMGSLENWEEFLSLEEETSLGGHVSGSVNLNGTTCCDPSPSQQPVLRNRDMMPTTHVMSHLVAREDERSVTVKVSYRDRTIKLFQVPLTTRIIEVKEEVKKRLKLEPSNFDFEYKDEDGDWIFLGCDEDLTNHLQLFSNRVIRLLVVDSDASTKNICESCGSLKRKRQ